LLGWPALLCRTTWLGWVARLAGSSFGATPGVRAARPAAARFAFSRRRPLPLHRAFPPCAGRSRRLTGGMAIGVPARDEQPATERIGWRGRSSGATTGHVTAAAHPCAVRSVVFRRTEPGRQGAIVRKRLLFALAPAVAVVFLEQAELHHYGLCHI